MARLSALRLRGVFKVRVRTPLSWSRVKSSDGAATEDGAVMSDSRFCEGAVIMSRKPNRVDEISKWSRRRLSQSFRADRPMMVRRVVSRQLGKKKAARRRPDKG